MKIFGEKKVLFREVERDFPLYPSLSATSGQERFIPFWVEIKIITERVDVLPCSGTRS